MIYLFPVPLQSLIISIEVQDPILQIAWFVLKDIQIKRWFQPVSYILGIYSNKEVV